MFFKNKWVVKKKYLGLVTVRCFRSIMIRKRFGETDILSSGAE